MTTTLDRLDLLTTCISVDDLDDLRRLSQAPRLESPAGPLPLVEVAAETTIDALIATTRYTQRFVNPTTDHLEVSYIFPLPSRAGVTDFTAVLGGRRIEGILKERGEARADYDRALAESKRAALVEAERPDVFTAKIGNIAPGEEAVIELVVTGPLVVEDTEATFRFPLVTAPRYISGTPLDEEPAGTGTTPDTDAVPDASRLNPALLSDDQPRPKLSFRVRISYPGVKAATLRTSHPMAIQEEKGTAKKTPRTLTLTLDENEKMDADLLVRFDLPKDLTVQAVISDDVAKKSATGAKEKTGTWSVTVVAPRQDVTTPRDIVFVLDRSGSMGGWKMVAARRAAARLVDSLLPDDRFALVTFDDRMDVFSIGDESQSTSDTPRAQGGLKMFSGTDRNRFAAISWLSTCQARGGTEMKRPLTEAVELLSTTSPDREPVVVLVTDGQIGAEAQLLQALEPRLGRTRFCVVGIDRVPNTSLIERLGRQSNGYTTFVESEDRLDEALRNLHRRIGRPDLLSVTVAAEGVRLLDEETSPGQVVDVFSGVPRIITGRYVRTGTKLPVLTITAEKADGTGTFTQRVTAVKSPSKGIADTWARSRIADLEDRYDALRSNLADTGSGLRAQIIAVSIAQRVLSRFTAFVAVDAETQDIASSREMTQPVESPAGWEMSNIAMVAFAGTSTPTGGGSLLRSFSSLAAVNTTSDLSLVASSDLGGWNSTRGPSSSRMLRTIKGTSPGAVVTQSALELLEECLDRLSRATSKRPARVADLARRLTRLQTGEPSVLAALAELYGYIATTSTLAATIKAVEAALQTLRLRSVPRPTDTFLGGGAFAPSRPPREFWS
jgi:hypothetical protein